MIKNIDRFFDEAQVQAEKLLNLLIEGHNLFPKKLVPSSLLNRGYTYYKGIIVPLSDVSHKYIYDEYEVPFLEAFILLFKKILEERDSTTSEFAFRTLLEMGVEDSFIIFDDKVIKEHKKLYITLMLLADYSAIETSMRDLFKNWFNKLYEETKNFLTEKLSEREMRIIDGLKETVNQRELDQDQYTTVLRQVRDLVNRVKNRLFNYYGQKKVFELSNSYKRMKSGESHTIHGNVFLIRFRMGQQLPKNHLFRVYAYLTIAGNDLLTHLSRFHKNEAYSKKVAQYLDDNLKFRSKLSSKWEQNK